MKEQKNTISSRTLINIIGIFIFIGLALSHITQSYSSNQSLETFMNTKKTKEIYIFLTVTSILFFTLANIYFIGKIGKIIFYTALSLIFIICCYLF
ncbi:hypothetical protein R0K04_19495, partial [Pseudoalteromonas sp. SIMBA_153]